MKYYKEYYDDENRVLVREEITREKAIYYLNDDYKKPEELVEMPWFYRTIFGGIDVVAE